VPDVGDELKMDCFRVLLKGPEGTPYFGYSWQVRFTVSDGFPFHSPSVGFVQHILHPNIDWASGSVCLDALNKKWSPIFTLKHIMESLLPYLLAYPNADDPLNRDASALLRDNPSLYTSKVLESVKRHGLKIDGLKIES
jgi:ubiquitin-conjugating enzyme E2 H